MDPSTTQTSRFSNYQILLTVLFSLTLFTIVVDYLTLPALSAILLSELQISTAQFGLLVSVYAFSAGISGFLATTFADRFDRKRLLVIYYAGFLLGMFLCAIANSLVVLIAARIVTGFFGGVVASICFAIISDLFKIDQRGRVMGFIQMAFAGSQIGGLPLALYMANQFNWQLIYWVLFIFGLLLLGIFFFKINPTNHHLLFDFQENSIRHALKVGYNSTYWMIFLNNLLIVLGDVIFMTFSAAYVTNNLGLSLEQLPLLFGIGGAATLIFGPIWGQLSDRYGKLNIFIIGSGLAIAMILIYSNIGQVHAWLIILINTLLFIGINARMVTSTAMATIVPEPKDRGTFMALDASLQQLAGGIAASLAGLIVFQSAEGMIYRYPLLGMIVTLLMLLTTWLMFLINRLVNIKLKV